MATRPSKIQKLTDQKLALTSATSTPAEFADDATHSRADEPTVTLLRSIRGPDESPQRYAQGPAVGQEVWHHQRREWTGSVPRNAKPPSRPVIRSNWLQQLPKLPFKISNLVVVICSSDSTYDTLLLTSKPFAVRIPLSVSTPRTVLLPIRVVHAGSGKG